MKIEERPLGGYNPFPHVIATSGIEHVADCPGCKYSHQYFAFVMRMLDRMEEDAD